MAGGGFEEIGTVDEPGEAVLEPEETRRVDVVVGGCEMAGGEDGAVGGRAVGDGEGEDGGDLLHDGAECDLFAVRGVGEADDVFDGSTGGRDAAVDHFLCGRFGVVDDDLCAVRGIVDDGEVVRVGTDGYCVGRVGDAGGEGDVASEKETAGVNELDTAARANGDASAAVGEIGDGDGGGRRIRGWGKMAGGLLDSNPRTWICSRGRWVQATTRSPFGETTKEAGRTGDSTRPTLPLWERGSRVQCSRVTRPSSETFSRTAQLAVPGEVRRRETPLRAGLAVLTLVRTELASGGGGAGVSLEGFGTPLGESAGWPVLAVSSLPRELDGGLGGGGGGVGGRGDGGGGGLWGRREVERRAGEGRPGAVGEHRFVEWDGVAERSGDGGEDHAGGEETDGGGADGGDPFDGLGAEEINEQGGAEDPTEGDDGGIEGVVEAGPAGDEAGAEWNHDHEEGAVEGVFPRGEFEEAGGEFDADVHEEGGDAESGDGDAHGGEVEAVEAPGGFGDVNDPDSDAGDEDEPADGVQDAVDGIEGAISGVADPFAFTADSLDDAGGGFVGIVVGGGVRGPGASGAVGGGGGEW